MGGAPDWSAIGGKPGEAVGTALSSKVVVARGQLLIRGVPVLTDMWQNWLNPLRAIGL
jgi:hypothetical protein